MRLKFCPFFYVSLIAVSFFTQGHEREAPNHYNFYANWRTFLMGVYRKTIIHFENKERLGKVWVPVTEYTICNPVHLFPLGHLSYSRLSYRLSPVC